MSGNGAQGTKFRISVCTDPKEFNRDLKFEKESLDEFNAESKQVKDMNRNNYMLNRQSKIMVKFDLNLAKQFMEKQKIIKKNDYMRKLRLDLRYLKLSKTSNKKKSYKNKNKLLKLCELVNEDSIQESKGLDLEHYYRQSRNYNGSEVILKDLLPKKDIGNNVMIGEKRKLEQIDEKNSKCDGSKDCNNKRVKVIVNSVTLGYNLNKNLFSN